jgi:hypothetical protein
MRLDSRLRGNDSIWGVQRGEAPLRSSLPPRSKIRLRRSGGSRGLNMERDQQELLQKQPTGVPRAISHVITGSSQLQRLSETVFDTQTDSAVKFTYQINERRAYPL